MSQSTAQTKANERTNEAEIRKLIDKRINAVRLKNVDEAVAGVITDVLLFDVVNPLQSVGVEAARNRAQQWFASFDGPIDYEISNLRITAANEAAFCHGLSHVNAVKADGETLDMWWRTTLCFRRVDGNWAITHEHNSVPFDMKTGQASIDLKP